MQKQTKFHNPEKGIKGNCMVACYANYLGYKIEDCPAFEEIYECKYPDEFWYDCVKLWFKKLGYKITHVQNENNIPKHIEYYFAYGLSHRNVLHQVIFKNGKLFFDPSPSGKGLLTIQGFEYIETIK